MSDEMNEVFTKRIVVKVPQDTAIIPATNVLEWILDKLEPEPLENRPIIIMQKIDRELNQAFELDKSDLDLLQSIWSKLPDIHNKSRLVSISEYKAAFDESEIRPRWDLNLVFIDVDACAKIHRMNTSNRIFWSLDAKLKAGELMAITRNYSPVYEMSLSLGKRVYFKVADVKKILSEYDIELEQTLEVPESVHKTNKDEALKSHHSDKLRYLLEASGRFWERAARDDETTQPKSDDVVKWFKARGFSETLAQNAATIIRPEWAKLGRRPDK